MKKLILAAALTLGTTAVAQTGVIYSDADEATIRATVSAVNSGSYKGYFQDSCSTKRSVYAVSITNGGYHVDRNGDLYSEAPQAIIKYRCAGSDR